MINPTPRQIQVLAFVYGFTKTNAVAPTYQEIGERFSIGINAAVCHVRGLEKKGLLMRQYGKVRRMSITAAGRKVLKG